MRLGRKSARLEDEGFNCFPHKREKPSLGTERAFLRRFADARLWSGQESPYFAGGAGVKISRRLGSGLGFGLGAFFVSFLPLSLFPMARSLTQKRCREKCASG
jgi:hypothetical protein